MKYILQFLITAGIIYAIAQYHLVEGIILEQGYISALIFAVILSVVNTIFGTIIRIITLPIRLLTFGLVSFVIFIGVVYITDYLVPGVTLESFVAILAIAVAILISSIFTKIF